MFIHAMGIQCKKMLCLDVPIKYNSTFLMLEITEKYILAFDAMGEEDKVYVRHFE